jgi:DNA-binding IclR family transcriptional regulator
MEVMNADAGTEAKAPAQASASQTLSRGIRALEILAGAQGPLTIAELSAAMGVHRSVAYRILRTLEDHSLLVRDDAGRVQPGPGLAVLARSVARDLQAAALPELTALSNALDMTAFVAVWDHQDCITLVTVEPRNSGAAVAQHPGSRHPVQSGAPGIAIQSAMTEQEWNRLAPGVPYRREAGEARALGYAASHDEVIAGLSSVAAPIRVPGGRPASVAVVYIRSDQDAGKIGAAVSASADRIAAGLA